MGVVNEPITECIIVFKYLYWTPDRKDKRYYHDRFQTIPQLREYFKRNPAAGALVGYGKTLDGTAFAFEGSLLIEWTDNTAKVSKEFVNVHTFADFLKENPALGKYVKFEVKG